MLKFSKIGVKFYNLTNFKVVLYYTILFVVMLLICFSPFLLNNKSLIWINDSALNFKSVLWYARYIRECINNILTNHSFNFRQFDFYIGEGTDIFLFFNQYCLGDPFTFFAFLVPDEYIFIYYQIMNIIRIYLAGLIYIYMCKTLKITNFLAQVSGSFIYIFSYFSILNVARHHFFLIPLPLLPLIIIGIEKIFNNEKPYIYILSIALAGISNFFFFFQIVILVILYILVKLFHSMLSLNKFFDCILKMFIYSLIGVLIASITLIPAVHVAVFNGRTNVDFPYYILYPIKYYYQFFGNFLSYKSAPYWTDLGLTGISFLAICFMFLNKGSKQIKNIFLIVLFMILIPICGKLMNGNGYVINRWCWAFALVISYIVSYEFDSMIIDFNNHLTKLLFALILYLFILYLVGFSDRQILQLIIVFIFCIISRHFLKNMFIKQIFLFSLLCLSICINSIVFFSPKFDNYISQCFDQNKVNENMLSSEADYIKNIDNSEDYFRYAAPQYPFVNGNMIANLSSINYVNSYTPKYLKRFKNTFGLFDGRNTISFWGYDLNTILLQLSSVKYLLQKPKGVLPYGYSKINGLNYNSYEIYENLYSLPIIYSYNCYVDVNKTIGFSPAELQNTIMKYAVVDNYKGTIEKITPETSDINKIDYLIKPESKDVIIGDNSIITYKKNQKIKLKFDAIDKSELHLSWENLDFRSFSDYDLKYENVVNCNGHLININPNKQITTTNDNVISLYYKKLLSGVGTTSTRLTYSNGLNGVSKYFVNRDYQFYGGEHNFDVNFGYNTNSTDHIDIVFSEIGVYTFDKLGVFALDFKNYSFYNDNLKLYGSNNFVIKNDYLSFDLDVNEDRLVCVSIPYYDGWKVFIDGKPTDKFISNIYHIGFDVPPGKHKVELKYDNSVLLLGRIGSLIGILMFLCMFLYYRNKEL